MTDFRWMESKIINFQFHNLFPSNIEYTYSSYRPMVHGEAVENWLGGDVPTHCNIETVTAWQRIAILGISQLGNIVTVTGFNYFPHCGIHVPEMHVSPMEMKLHLIGIEEIL